MSTSSPKRRVSAAAAKRHRQALEAQQSMPRVLDPELTSIVMSFDVSRYGKCSQPVHPFLLDAITRSDLTGKESVRKHCRHLTALAVFSDAQGLALSVEAVLTTKHIDDFIRRGMPNDTDHNRAERRSRLLWLASTVNPGPNTPAKCEPIGHSAVKPPYTPSERGAIVRAARTQPTRGRAVGVAAVVGLGLGAGADSIDLRHLWVDNIADHGDDGLLVAFQDPRPRVVPVRRCAEDLVRIAITGRRPDELVIGKDENRRNTAARAIENAALYRVPHLEVARLRATWLVDLMTDPIPLALILQAAGLKSARTLADLLPHTETWARHKSAQAAADAILRGGVR